MTLNDMKYNKPQKPNVLVTFGLIVFLFIMSVFLAWMWSIALSGEAAEGFTAQSNIVIDTQNNIVYRFDSDVYVTNVLQTSGYYYVFSTSPWNGTCNYSYCSLSDFNTSLNPWFQSAYGSVSISPSFVRIVQGKFTYGFIALFEQYNLYSSTQLLYDSSLYDDIPLVPSSKNYIYLSVGGFVNMYESDSPFYIFTENGSQYIWSDSSITQYIYINGGWQQYSAFVSSPMTNKPILKYNNFITLKDSSCVLNYRNYAFKGELSSGSEEASPTPSPSPAPNSYEDFVSNHLDNDYIYIVYYTVDSGNEYIVVSLNTSLNNYVGQWVYGKSYKRFYFNYSDHTFSRYVNSSDSFKVNSADTTFFSVSTYSPTFNSLLYNSWPFLGILGPSPTPTPSPIPTFEPTASPVPTSTPVPTATPPVSSVPVVTSMPLVDINPNYVDDIIKDSGNYNFSVAYGLWAAAFSFIPDQLAGLVWIFLSSLICVSIIYLIVRW